MKKVVLITGCASGFGKLFVEELLKEGHRVIATMRKAKERSHLFSDFLKNPKYKLLLLELDINSSQDRKEVKEVIEKLMGGQLDCLINNAGQGLYGALEDLSEGQIRQQMELNFFGNLFMIKDFLPLLRASKGKIFNITSLMGRMSMPLSSLYSASKFALEGLGEGLAYELAPLGVQVCNVAPGGHRTYFLKNIQWGHLSKLEGRPYFNQGKNLEVFMKKLNSGKGTPPDQVVHIVKKLLEKERIPLHVTVGKDAQIGERIRKILPRAFYFFLMRKLYTRLFTKNLNQLTKPHSSWGHRE